MEYTFNEKEIIEKAKKMGFKIKTNSDNPGIYIKETGETLKFSEVLEVFEQLEIETEE